MNRDTILRRTSAAPLRTLSSTNSSPAPAASTPACGAGARRPPSPAGTTAARRDGTTGQRLGLASHQAVETMDPNVHTVSSLHSNLLMVIKKQSHVIIGSKCICKWHIFTMLTRSTFSILCFYFS